MHIPLASARCVALFKSYGPPPQARNVRLEVGPSRIIGGNFIQVANAVHDIRHPAEQDRDEGGHRAENEGRRRCLRHHLRKLTNIRNKVHASAASAWKVATYRRTVAIMQTRSSSS